MSWVPTCKRKYNRENVIYNQKDESADCLDVNIVKEQTKDNEQINVEPENKLAVSEGRDQHELLEKDGKQGTPRYDAPTVYTKGEELILGLPNRNSTSCYITSLIQVLAQTPGLIECLLSYKQKSCIAETLINLFCAVNDAHDQHGNVAEVLCSLLRDIQNKMAARDDSFSEGILNDSHCLLLCLLNALDDEDRDGLYIFDGQMRNSFTYSNCSHEEESALEPFKSLPMSVNNNLSTVEDSIMHMISVNIFYDSDIPCRKCIKEGRHSQDTVTEKRLIIVVAPEILVLQLSRFHQVWASGDKLCTKMEKYDGHVQYPSTLSLPVIQKDEDDHTGFAVTYELYGVICHEGTMEKGHYWCYVKQNGWDKAHPYLWHLCSDSYVRRLEINEEWPDSPYAYLLFYKQCMKGEG